MSTSVLLYNFSDGERLGKIRRYLNKEHISICMVTAPEFLHPLGYLFHMNGYDRNPVFNFGQNFTDEMMVLKDFSGKQLDDFLGFFPKENLPPVKLKAILTPVTVHWNSIQLHDELTKEHQMMNKK